MDSIIEKIVSGDIEALSELYNEYNNLIFKYILMMTKNKTLAEDITQEVFVAVIQKGETYKQNISIKAWLLKIARNKAINQIKHEAFTSNVGDDVINQEQHIDKNDFEFLDEIGMLNEEQRNLIILHILYGFTHNEISEIICKSPSAIRKQYERALKVLKKTYNKGAVYE